MRHRKAGFHLGRTAAHRKALFSNMVTALIEHEKIRTTDAKARATRRIAERTITLARRVGDVLQKDPGNRSVEEKARIVHAMREARKIVRDRETLQKIFNELAPRYAGRHGGYTRIIKLGERPGDAAPMAILELLPETEPQAKTA